MGGFGRGDGGVGLVFDAGEDAEDRGTRYGATRYFFPCPGVCATSPLDVAGLVMAETDTDRATDVDLGSPKEP